MNIYLVNALLILLVVRQIREHQLHLRALAVPVLAVAAAAVMFLHAVPTGGSDITLDLLCASAGAAMGAIGGLATRLRPGPDGRPLGRAGVLAASMWIAGVGARMVFYFAATHGADPATAPDRASRPAQARPYPPRRRRPRRLCSCHHTARSVSCLLRAEPASPSASRQHTGGLIPASIGSSQRQAPRPPGPPSPACPAPSGRP